MRSLILISLFFLLSSNIIGQTPDNVPIAIHSFTLEFELNNDQGELSTKDYLKQYGTKGKTRAHEALYPILVDFFSQEFESHQIPVGPIDQLADLKANAYGIPSMTLGKAVKSKRSERYLKISMKDIGQVPPGQMENSSTSVIKVVKIRCRLQLYDADKNLLKDSEDFFATGEKVNSKYNIGVDLRQYRGSGRQQELKFYEVCCKMAFMRALEKF